MHENGDLQLVAGKQNHKDDWRGTGIVHTMHWAHSRNKLLRCGFTTTLQSSSMRVCVVAGHLPHHATIAETEDIAASLDGSCPFR